MGKKGLILLLFVSLKGYTQIDKVYHFSVGLGISTISVPFDNNKAKIIGIGSATIAGLAKEYYDYRSYGRFDLKDAFFTTLGGIAGTYTILMLKRIFIKHHSCLVRPLFLQRPFIILKT